MPTLTSNGNLNLVENHDGPTQKLFSENLHKGRKENFLILYFPYLFSSERDFKNSLILVIKL